MLKRIGAFICLLALLHPLVAVHAQEQEKKEQDEKQRPALVTATARPADEDALVIPEGTEMQLALREPISSKLSEAGDEIYAVVRRDVVVEGRVLLREGTEVVGRITLAQPAKRPLKGGRLHLTFERIRLPEGERRLSVVIKSASDFSRDEKIKSDGEGTLKGGKDGGKVLSNVSTAAGIASIGATIILIGGARNGGFGGFGGGLGGGTVAAAAGVYGGSVIAGILLSKGKEVRLDQNAILRVKLERPLSIS